MSSRTSPQARAAAEAIRNERVAAWGLTPTARCRFRNSEAFQKYEKGTQAKCLDALLSSYLGGRDGNPPLLGSIN